MPKVYLTAAEREVAREQQRQEALMQKMADGLATYRNRKGLTKVELGKELGLCAPTVVKLLTGQPTQIRTDTLWKIFHIAGIKVDGSQSV